MKTQILNHILANTDYDTMDCLSTKEVAQAFNITTKEAYSILKQLAKEKLITYLEPVNSKNLDCADWITNENNG